MVGPAKNRVLAIGSHFDDVEIAMGGTILKHRDIGDDVVIAVLKADESLTAPAKVREEEQNKALKFSGARGLWFYKDDDIEETVRALDDVSPTILYFPFEKDYHQDHNFASKVGFAVSRHIKATVLRYLVTTSHSYYPNYFSLIDMSRKKKLVSIFKSQVNRNPKFLEIMETQNRFFGSLIPGDGHYAEGFCLHRKVV
jgi:LmbE family N-acetylglucosaminyl deacetylase